MFKKNIHYSTELETFILGACLLEQSAFSRVFGVLTPETFYSKNLGWIFAFMIEMFDSNLPINLLSVNDYIQRQKRILEFSEKPTHYFLTLLTNSVTSTACLEYYALILKQMWIDREIITLTSSGVTGEDTRQEINKLQHKLTELTSTSFSSDWKSMDELMVGLYKHQDEMLKTKGMGIATKIPTIDRLYGGLFPGQMIVIGARPSVGKSALSGQLAINMAENGTKVGIISLEMNNNEIAGRFAAIDTNQPFNDIYRGLYTDENERERFYKKINDSTSKLTIYVSDKIGLNISEIKAKAYQLKYKHGLDCLIIDYLQLVTGDTEKNRTRENEVSKMSLGCKIIAKEMGVPVIVLCQLNREVTSRTGDKRFPQLSDFRESGAIEQDADAAMFLHSDFMSGITADENGNSTENVRQLVIRKWRNGVPNVIIDLDFDGPKMSMKEKGFTPANFKSVAQADREQFYKKNDLDELLF